MKYFTCWNNRHHLLVTNRTLAFPGISCINHGVSCVSVCDSVIENSLSCLGKQPQQKCLSSLCRFSLNDILAETFYRVQSHSAAAAALPEVSVDIR